MKDWYTEKRVSRSIFGSILEYEYLYLNGELDIDCIYLKKTGTHRYLQSGGYGSSVSAGCKTFSRISKR